VRRVKAFIAGILCVASLAAVPLSFAGREYVLVGGRRAVIEGEQLILIDAKSNRTVAQPGIYEIRRSDYAIYVTEQTVKVRPKQRRPQ